MQKCCVVCDSQFETTQPHAKYCDGCRRPGKGGASSKHRRKPIHGEKSCDHCGQRFIAKTKKVKYCSLRCARLENMKKVPMPDCSLTPKQVAIRDEAEIYKRWARNAKRLARYERIRAKRARIEAKKGIIIHCRECGNEFNPTKRRIKFCSPKCRRKDERRRSKHIRRAALAGANSETVVANKVFSRDGWRCQICGKDTPRSRRGSYYSNAPELDHRVPLSRGGSHTYANTQCACRACNSEKGNKSEVGQISLSL